jgi:hypothetical protein
MAGAALPSFGIGGHRQDGCAGLGSLGIEGHTGRMAVPVWFLVRDDVIQSGNDEDAIPLGLGLGLISRGGGGVWI